MGANKMQAQALALFFTAFIFIAASFAASFSWLLMIVGLALAAGAVALFRKCKPWEDREG
jgi:predicted phage tail protein